MNTRTPLAVPAAGWWRRMLSLVIATIMIPSLAEGQVFPPIGGTSGLSGPPERSQEQREIDSSVRQGTLGIDLQLGGDNEPTVVVDPNNPQRIAMGTVAGIRVSTDGGATFRPQVDPTIPNGFFHAGDPSLAYDRQGRLFWTYLVRKIDLTGMDIFIAQCDPTTGAILAGYPVNVTASPGVALPANAGNTHDKQWLAVDQSAGIFAGRLYICWTQFEAAGTRILTAYSADQGMTWNALTQLSAAAEGFVWPSHNTVAPNGDVYVAYHSMFSDGAVGQVFVCRSVNGGVAYPQKELAYGPGEADVTFNIQGFPSAIPGTQFWLQGNAQPWVMADPKVAGRIYVVASDDPDNNLAAGDPSDIYLAISDNFGMAGSWAAPARIDDGPGNSFAVMPTAAIERRSGLIAVHWYDNRRGLVNADGRFLLDVFATFSSDGGNIFSPDRRMNDDAFDPDPGAPCRFGPPNCDNYPGAVPADARTSRIGEYNGVAVSPTHVLMVWTGNGVDGLGNPVQQAVFDRIPIRAPSLAIGVTSGQAEFASVPLAAARAGDPVYGNGVFIANNNILIGPGANFPDLGLAFNSFSPGAAAISPTPYRAWRQGPAPFGVGLALYGAVAGPSGGGVFWRDPTSCYEFFPPNPDATASVNVMTASAIFTNTGVDVLTRAGTAWGCRGFLPTGAYASLAVVGSINDPVSGLPVPGIDPIVIAMDANGGLVSNGNDFASAATASGLTLTPAAGGFNYSCYGVSNGPPMFWPSGTACDLNVTVTLIADPQADIRYDATIVPDSLAPEVGSGDVPGELVVGVESQFPAEAMALASPSPNPTSGPTKLDFVLPHETGVRITVFDVHGRRVAVVADRVYPAGRHSAKWDGRGANNRPVASGIYMLRFEAAGRTDVKRVVVIR